MNTESTEHRSAHSESGVSNLRASTRCIMIPELRWKIFDLVTVVGPFELVSVVSIKKTLMALALVCKSFSGPALDLVWRNLRGFESLIRCLPQSLWKQDKKKLEFQRTMTLDDWSIFCKYNYRVRSLVNRCHESYINNEVICSTEIWRALSCPPFSLPLLPNLTSLTWIEASDETFQYIRLFVTPGLTMLNISARARSYYGTSFTFGPSEQSIFSSIAKSCPFISQFDFDFCRSWTESTESVGDTSTVLQFWSHLTSVRTGTISEAAILHLSKLPSLRVLKCHLPSTSISTDAQKLLQLPVFCALQKLDVTCKSPLVLEAFLEKLTITPEVLSFTITHGVDSARALPGLISRLSNACADNSLQEVQLSITGQPTNRDTSIEAAAFQPLLAFRNIRKFHFAVDGHCIVRMDDATLLQLAKAWPLLEDLSITGYSRSNHQITPHAFVLLLWHCQRLVSLAIPVDWFMIDMHDIPRDIPYPGFSHSALSHLVFEGSRIDNPISIAAFISAIAPNVKSIQGDDEDSHEDDIFSENYPAWTMVQDLVAALPIIRQQGMRMVLNQSMRGL